MSCATCRTTLRRFAWTWRACAVTFTVIWSSIYMTTPAEAPERAVVDYYLDPFAPLLAAMVDAEGGPQAFVKALQCSRRDVVTFEHALAVAAKTVRRLYANYSTREDPIVLKPRAGQDAYTGENRPWRLVVTDGFIEYIAKTWAPVGAENDPTNLNVNWPRNVKQRYRVHAGLEGA